MGGEEQQLHSRGAVAFWSYVRDDDEHEQGRIRQLAQDLEGEVRMLTAADFTVFVDRDQLSWGDTWRQKLEEGLREAAFFVPVLTPRYFQSSACRQEFESFTEKATDLGLTELVLPLHYVNVDGLAPAVGDATTSPGELTDPLIGSANDFQIEDWRKLRFDEAESRRYRDGVHRLAQQVARRVQIISSEPTSGSRSEAMGPPQSEPPTVGSMGASPDDSQLGFLEVLAAGEEAMPRWQEATTAIADVMKSIGAISKESLAELNESDRRNKGFAGRLNVARRLAARLVEQAEILEPLSHQFEEALSLIDPMIAMLLDHLEQGREPVEGFLGLFSNIRGMHGAMVENAEHLIGLRSAMDANAQFARDLKDPTARIKASLGVFEHAAERVSTWIARIDELDPPHAGDQ